MAFPVLDESAEDRYQSEHNAMKRPVEAAAGRSMDIEGRRVLSEDDDPSDGQYLVRSFFSFESLAGLIEDWNGREGDFELASQADPLLFPLYFPVGTLELFHEFCWCVGRPLMLCVEIKDRGRQEAAWEKTRGEDELSSVGEGLITTDSKA